MSSPHRMAILINNNNDFIGIIKEKESNITEYTEKKEIIKMRDNSDETAV